MLNNGKKATSLGRSYCAKCGFSGGIGLVCGGGTSDHCLPLCELSAKTRRTSCAKLKPKFVAIDAKDQQLKFGVMVKLSSMVLQDITCIGSWPLLCAHCLLIEFIIVFTHCYPAAFFLSFKGTLVKPTGSNT